MTRTWAGAAVAVGLLATVSLGQPPVRPAVAPGDPLADARARQQLNDQRAAADVAAALADADKLFRISPVKAVRRLKDAQGAVDLSAVVSPDARKNLTVMLQNRIAALEGRPPVVAEPAPANPGRVGQNKVFEAYIAEAKAVQDGVAKAKALQDAGRTAEAAGVVRELTGKYPNNPAVLALGQKDDFADRVAAARVLAVEQERGVRLALNSVQKSAVPAAGDIEFPADWVEKSRRRLKQTELSEKEKKLLEALDKPVTLALNNMPFEEVLQELSNRMEQPILVDPRSLADAGLDLRKPVSAAGTNLSARTFLRQALGAMGLTFVVKDETIQVVTVERARDMLVTRAYYLGDLVQGVGPFGGAVTWGPALDYEQTMANVNQLIDAIVTSIEPLSWRGKGGPGTVTFHFPSMSLIVRQSAEVHAVLGSRFTRGR